MLYRAKENGRNRVEPDENMVLPETESATSKPVGHKPADHVAAVPVPAGVRAAAAISVPIMVR
jgi:hypothetical protein